MLSLALALVLCSGMKVQLTDELVLVAMYATFAVVAMSTLSLDGGATGW